MRLAVLGGGGFIGSATCRHLAQSGIGVRILERPGRRPGRPLPGGGSVEWIEIAENDSGALADALDSVETVIHLASTTLPHTAQADPSFDIRTNLLGTVELLEAMVARGVGRIVFVSSGGTVYGEPDLLPIPEDHPLRPRAIHGTTKVAIESLLGCYERSCGLRADVLRVANAYGEGQRSDTGQGVVATFIHRVLNGQPIEIRGDGTAVRDYVHVDDVAAAIGRVLGYSGRRRVFNIGSGQGIDVNRLVGLIEQALGQTTFKSRVPALPLDVSANVLDITRARQELGWKPSIGLEQGIRRTAGWLARPDRVQPG